MKTANTWQSAPVHTGPEFSKSTLQGMVRAFPWMHTLDSEPYECADPMGYALTDADRQLIEEWPWPAVPER